MFGKYIYDYRVGKDSVEVVLFGKVPVYSIKFDSISEIEIVPLKATLFTSFSTLRLGNNLSGKIVSIQKNDGVIKTVLITPEDPENFVKSVKVKIKFD